MNSDELYQKFINNIELNDKNPNNMLKKHFKQLIHHYFSKYKAFY